MDKSVWDGVGLNRRLTSFGTKNTQSELVSSNAVGSTTSFSENESISSSFLAPSTGQLLLKSTLPKLLVMAIGTGIMTFLLVIFAAVA